MAILGQGVKTSVRLAGIVVLARLLTPEDFGLVAMVTVITGFVGMFTDVGLSAATIQRPTVTHGQVSTLFWLNVALGCFLATLTAVFAPLIAWFYGEPRLTLMTICLASTFILAGLTVQHQAILRRKMRFHVVTAIGIATQFMATVVAIIASWVGWGPWSLVFMSMTNALAMMLLCWAFSGWLPGWPVKQGGVREMLRFGGWLTGFSSINYFLRNADNLLIGWWWGAAPLGLYSRAYSLLVLPLSQIKGPIDGVAMPTLSRHQHDRIAFQKQFLQLYRITIGLSAPVSAIAFVLAEEIVLILLGRQWIEAVSLFRVLAISAVLQPIWSMTGWFFVPLNRTRDQFVWGLGVSLVILPGFILGLPYGPIGVAAGYTTSLCLVIWPALAYATHGTLVKPIHFGSGAAGEFAAAGLAGGVAWTTATWICGSMELIPRGIFAGGAGAATAGLLLWILNNPVFEGLPATATRRIACPTGRS